MKRLPFEKPRKARKASISRLKRKAWAAFSAWVRQRGAGPGGMQNCVTCPKTGHWKEFHAGHYLHGHSKASFMVEENVNVQCPRCNHFLSGNLLKYHDFMLAKYGQEVIDKIKALSHQIWKPSRIELESLISKYQEGE